MWSVPIRGILTETLTPELAQSRGQGDLPDPLILHVYGFIINYESGLVFPDQICFCLQML